MWAKKCCSRVGVVAFGGLFALWAAATTGRSEELADPGLRQNAEGALTVWAVMSDPQGLRELIAQSLEHLAAEPIPLSFPQLEEVAETDLDQSEAVRSCEYFWDDFEQNLSNWQFRYVQRSRSGGELYLRAKSSSSPGMAATKKSQPDFTDYFSLDLDVTEVENKDFIGALALHSGAYVSAGYYRLAAFGPMLKKDGKVALMALDPWQGAVLYFTNPAPKNYGTVRSFGVRYTNKAIILRVNGKNRIKVKLNMIKPPVDDILLMLYPKNTAAYFDNVCMD